MSTLRDSSGAAAVEFALWLTILVYPLINVFDLGVYIYKRMELDNAAQMSAQAIFNGCGQIAGANATLSSTCSNFTTYRDAGVHSTSLGSNVSATTSEGAYCTTGTGSAATLTTTCASGTVKGHYLTVTATYTYTPLFRAATITSVLNTNLSRSYWMRTS
jgi:Flp pilus assembly protein TadG